MEVPTYQVTVQTVSQPTPPFGMPQQVTPASVIPQFAAPVFAPTEAQTLDEERLIDLPPADIIPATAASDAPRAGAPAPLTLGLSRAVAVQLAEIARTLPDGPVELTLNPEELGKVRMSLSAAETSIAVALTIERPETAELMRRHLDILEAEFRALGYQDVAFSFAGGDAQQRDSCEETEQRTLDPAAPTETADSAAPKRILMGGGVDLRL